MKELKKVRLLKKIFFTMLAFSIIFASTTNYSIYAASSEKVFQDKTDTSKYEQLGTEMLVNQSDKDVVLTTQSTFNNDIPNYSISAVTSSGFVTGFSYATQYYNSNFSQYQYNNNCTPTLAANVLSYYKTSRGVNLYSGTITQTLYDQICTDVSYSTEYGSNLNNVANGLKIFSSRAGKTCIVNKYWLNTWSDVTRDINADKVVMLGYSNHAYLILGYKVENDIQQLFVSTGWSDLPYQWLTFSSGMQMQSVYIY